MFHRFCRQEIAGVCSFVALRGCRMTGHADTARLLGTTPSGQAVSSKGRGFKTPLRGIAARARVPQGAVLMTRVNCNSLL
jgi:hypothetical protein